MKNQSENHDATTCAAFSPQMDVFVKLLPTRLQNVCRRGSGETVRAVAADEWKETVTFRYSRANTHMSSQRLGRHANDYHSLKPLKISALRS